MNLVPTLHLVDEIGKLQGKQFVVKCDEYLMYGVGVNQSISILSQLTNDGITTMKFLNMDDLKRSLPSHLKETELQVLSNSSIEWTRYLDGMNRIEKTGIEMINPYQIELRA